MTDEVVPRLVEIAYELAAYYHLDPDVFLVKPIDDLLEHQRETEKLLKRIGKSKGS